MSVNRDKSEDLRRTGAVLAGGPLQDPADPAKNWLGHTKGAAEVDRMLLTGATREQMETARGGVDEHLRHLRVEHGLTVVNEGGVYSFDRSGSAAGRGPSGSPPTAPKTGPPTDVPVPAPPAKTNPVGRSRSRLVVRALVKSLLVAAASAVGAKVGGWLGAVLVAVLTSVLAVLTEPPTE
jgi:hypothetical protein